MEKEHIQQAEEAIRKAERLNRRLLSGQQEEADAGVQAFPADKLEENVERLHAVARMDRQKLAGRLRERIEADKRRRVVGRRWWTLAAGVAAVLAIAVGIRLFYLQEEPERHPVRVGEILVPTLLQEQDEQIVSARPLDLKRKDKTYNVEASHARRKRKAAEEPVVMEQAVIPPGYTYTVRLADGSEVVLNARSELRFPSRFGDTARVVELKGEAYFKVAKSAVPFIVKAGDTQVKVYGTQFNFLYSEQLGISEAVLVEGSIGMAAGEEEVRIVPNQRVYRQAGAALQVEEVNPSDYTAWMGKTFKYSSVPLERIVYDISNWYGIDIDLSPDLRDERYYMEFDKSTSPDRALQILGIIIGRPINQEGGAYIIK